MPDMFQQLAQRVGVESSDRPRIYKKTIGATTGYGFVEFMINLFMANEVRRYTDSTLKKIILAEFGHNDRTAKSFIKGNQSVGKLRIEFNSGIYMPQAWPVERPGHPPVISLKWNQVNGVYRPVRSRICTKTLTNGELRELLFRFPRVQETPEKLFERLGRDRGNWNNDSATE